MLTTRYNPNTYYFLNSLLDDLQQKHQVSVSSDFTPSINSREGESAYHIEVDLPGVKKEDISVSVEDGKLIISGERAYKEEVKEENYYKVESRFGKFSRSFTLPEEADIEQIHAESQDGVLEVIIPKLQSALVDKVKKIEIK
ncbi:MAG: Hsp20/alpha crystallin family protein [Campylobacterales bacterium]|nr:Hsp20/alpha crystallin family protein [Campylobacterales bacterium]